MSEKRKDSKGRILKTGESQRKDGLYQYRYADVSGVRRTVYANDLKQLRQKEAEIEKALQQGISFFEGNTPLSELIKKLFHIKKKWKESTRLNMGRVLNVIEKSRLYNQPINKIKMTDCKAYCVQLQEEGYSFSYIANIHSILKSSFALACEDDVLAKNPCSFTLKSVIEDDRPNIQGLTDDEVTELLEFLQNDTYGKRCYDMVRVLLGTGMRIGEFGALTINDIDFAQNVIHVNKQLQRLVGKVVITKTKTSSGTRDIPMTPAVRSSICNLLNERRKNKMDMMIDGHVGFLVVTKNGRPRTGPEYADSLRSLVRRYNETATHKIERCTPHVFRHTFCTKCISSGIDIKTVQYLMGHSDAVTTLNVYSDSVFTNVESGIKLLASAGI